MADYLEMSDEEFANLVSPPETNTTAPVEPEEVEEEDLDTTESEADVDADPDTEDSENDEDLEEDTSEESSTDVADTDSSLGSDQQETTADTKTEEEVKDSTETGEESNYKAFYEKVMAPFKANGKLIELKSPEEAIQLMQMGANFTRKMQDIAPHRKILLMLENNGLLDETKLSYLIDVDKKNPEAIKRLVKDSGIDPLDIDTETEPAYTVGNHHAVSDHEANFRSVLDELVSTPTGQETARVINEWDQASKNKLWNEPAAMVAINQQRENGIYDLITSEIERQKALGNIPVNTPFLDAYTHVGNMLQQAGALGTPQPQAPIATKVAAPKNRVDNSDKAKAAAPSKSTSKKAAPLVNPLAMSDEEFLKQMANRL